MKLSKDILAVMLLHYKEQFDSTLSTTNDELKELKTNCRALETDLTISRSVRENFTQQVILVERKCCPNEKHTRRECMEIPGIPESVLDDDLQDCALKIFNERDALVDLPNVEACQRSDQKLD